MITRREFLIASSAGLCMVAVPRAVFAQQKGKVWRIGILTGILRPSSLESNPDFSAFLKGMRDLDYVEGRNVLYEWRFAGGDPARFPDLAAGLVRSNFDIIVTAGGTATLAVKNATRTIPIVMAAAADPVGGGLVASLARPGGNVTGLTTVSSELSGKRLAILKESIPGISLIGVLFSPDVPGAAFSMKNMEAPSRTLGVQLQPFEIRIASDIDRAFSAMSRDRVGALMVVRGALANTHQTRIVELAGKNRMPSMGSLAGFAEAGGLLFYGVNDADLWRRAATYVDRILKGTKPADLPVEQPTKFELVINLKTAKALGIRIPQSLLVQADRVID